MPASSQRNLYVISAALMLVGLVCFLVVLGSVRESNGLSVIDAPVQNWLEGMRSPTLTIVMGTVATVFGPVAADFLLITAYLVFSRRRNPVSTVIALVVASVLAIATAACRVYLGYHWPTDVLASVSLSLVVVGGVITVDTWRTVRVQPAGQEHATGQVRAAGESP